MKLSILIPVYDNLHFTKQLIQSLEENIYFKDDCEVIILDNGSSDGTKEYLESLKSEVNSKLYYKIINLEKNIYVNPAWNKLVSEAKGEYVMILNNDITIPKNLDIKLIAYHNDGKIICPATSQVNSGQWFRQGTNINGTCFLLKKKDWIELPNELKLWFGDDNLFRELGVEWISDWIVHWGSQTINMLPELNEIIDNDRQIWIKLCLEKGWEDNRFPETLITNNK